MQIVIIQPVTDENYDTIRNHDRYGQALSTRETEIFLLITKGMSDQEIAIELGTSHQTVKNQINVIYQKLNINSKVQLLAAYIQHIKGEYLLPETIIKL